MKDVRITLLVTVTAIVGYAAMVLLSGCYQGREIAGHTYHACCYSNGQVMLDVDATSFQAPLDAGDEWRFTEAGTGKQFWITGDCVVALEK